MPETVASRNPVKEAAGAASSAQVVAEALALADDWDSHLGVFVSRFPERATAAADAADAARASGADHALLGLPLGVKDVVATEDGETTAQSLVLDRTWGTADATVVRRLRDAGMVVVGKTTTMEFAFGTPDPDKPFPTPRNPWAPTHWTGGSSSGSASGVAAGMMWGAIGTDTGASVRVPAALCGVTGLKPTFGRVPKSGCVPFSYSLDHVGPIARSARDCAAMLQTMAGPDPADPSSADRAVPDYVAETNSDLTGLRIGIDGLSRFAPGEDPAVAPLLVGVADTLRGLGAEIVDVELPLYREVTAVAVLSLLAEGLAYHSPDLRTRWADYFASTRVGLASATFVSGADYVQAQRIRRVGREAATRLFTDLDVILTPTVSRPAPLLADAPAFVASLFAGLDFAFHTAYWNALGNPALSAPMGFSTDGLPLGAQLIGRPFDEATVLRVGHAYQDSSDWHLATPRLQTIRPAAPAPAPPATETPVDDLARVAAHLAAHGITAPEDERRQIAASEEIVHQMASLVHGVPEARYANPDLIFRMTEIY